MLYNLLESKNYMHTAGKITIATAFIGILVFTFVFLFNAGTTELMKVEAQTATTTLTVLNTPPAWVVFAVEEPASATTTPTNSGSPITWAAVATDPNGASYYLLVCRTSAIPSSTNGGAPFCNGGQWGISSLTSSNATATVATTTTEVAPFSLNNDWWAWICDADPVNARCNASTSRGISPENSSPFVVNFRPVFGTYSNSSPADPGTAVNFTTSSTDPYGDDMTLVVCSTNSYSTSTNNCGSNTIATTTIPIASNPGAIYTLPAIIRDSLYDAYGFLVDEFGHEASGGAHGTNSQITVNNVAPTVSGISLNGGLDITLTQPGAQTTGFTLAFTTSDANSCRTIADGFEITNYVASVFRSSLGTSSCNGVTAGQYDPNDCYPSILATSTWNLNCTASSTTCTAGGGDATMDWACTFPLWFIADATDASSPTTTDFWVGAVAGIDDDNATGTLATSTTVVDVLSFTAIDLLSASIPYGQLEPGQNSGTLTASTSILSQGNTGLDQSLEGESMCTTFTVGNECISSASSTIAESEQEFATSTVAYGSGFNLSSTTPQQLELNVPKSTSTTTPNTGVTYWGINVPVSITLAGSYTGLNTFTAVTAEAADW
jgi:hypothetical protein